MQTFIPAIVALTAAAVPLAAPVPGLAAESVESALTELAGRPSGGGASPSYPGAAGKPLLVQGDGSVAPGDLQGGGVFPAKPAEVIAPFFNGQATPPQPASLNVYSSIGITTLNLDFGPGPYSLAGVVQVINDAAAVNGVAGVFRASERFGGIVLNAGQDAFQVPGALAEFLQVPRGFHAGKPELPKITDSDLVAFAGGFEGNVSEVVFKERQRVDTLTNRVQNLEFAGGGGGGPAQPVVLPHSSNVPDAIQAQISGPVAGSNAALAAVGNFTFRVFAGNFLILYDAPAGTTIPDLSQALNRLGRERFGIDQICDAAYITSDRYYISLRANIDLRLDDDFPEAVLLALGWNADSRGLKPGRPRNVSDVDALNVWVPGQPGPIVGLTGRPLSEVIGKLAEPIAASRIEVRRPNGGTITLQDLLHQAGLIQ